MDSIYKNMPKPKIIGEVLYWEYTTTPNVEFDIDALPSDNVITNNFTREKFVAKEHTYYGLCWVNTGLTHDNVYYHA